VACVPSQDLYFVRPSWREVGDLPIYALYCTESGECSLPLSTSSEPIKVPEQYFEFFLNTIITPYSMTST
jgi:hypothetical protein